MPRTLNEITTKADEIARRFNAGEIPNGNKPIDAAPLRSIREAFEDVAHAQTRLAERVLVARASGHSWAMIGAMLGTSGEAARQRYSKSSS